MSAQVKVSEIHVVSLRSRGAEPMSSLWPPHHLLPGAPPQGLNHSHLFLPPYLVLEDHVRNQLGVDASSVWYPSEPPIPASWSSLCAAPRHSEAAAAVSVYALPETSMKWIKGGVCEAGILSSSEEPLCTLPVLFCPPHSGGEKEAPGTSGPPVLLTVLLGRSEGPETTRQWAFCSLCSGSQ